MNRFLGTNLIVAVAVAIGEYFLSEFLVRCIGWLTKFVHYT